ncbi:F-box/LRR-repeat protein 4 [Anoplophora glabripennis]|uniref:F-box/LRR-repeat protein 4 n=1 Tax=Anoplophora glabripennis TaxID=217634 RepID=UPI000873B310|nr:F-box/LRR-repeat protein 4 [Anoplophora glabripennis]
MENNGEMGKFEHIETRLKMSHLEQYVFRVVNYTSRYNNSNSYSYAPINLVGKYVKYPSYGDFPEAYFLRSYGTWWKKSEGHQADYRPQDFDHLGAEDYITLEFESAVVPRDICVYEIYNPGAVVRIWCKLMCPSKRPWVLLWEGASQECPHKSRKFHPKIKPVNHMTNIIRLEINQSLLEYHWSIDAVLLGGCQPTSDLQYNMMLKGLIGNFQREDSVDKRRHSNDICDIKSQNEDLFLNLPYEVILHIFQYLDLKSLSRCAQVNKRWSEAAADPVLYQNLSLKPYWYLVNCSTLEHFMNKCKTLRKLDLSWCGNEVDGFAEQLKMFLRKGCTTLTHLSLGNCEYVNIEIMVEVSACKELVDLRLRNVGQWLQPSLDNLTKLVSLDLTGTDIQDNDLIKILKANRNLKHIIIDLCENLFFLDQVVETVVNYNKNLVTWSSWKTLSLTADGVKLFRECRDLRELDLGWCLINKDPGDCLEHVADGCKQLKRLILSGWRGLNDHLITPAVLMCKELSQLDLLGIKNISVDVCEKALLLLPKLRLLDISFCNSIRQDEVEILRQQYPHITIQRSCQYVVTDYLN